MGNVNGIGDVSPKLIQLTREFQAQHKNEPDDDKKYSKLCLFLQKNSFIYSDADRKYIADMKPKSESKENYTAPDFEEQFADPMSEFMYYEQQAFNEEIYGALGLDIYD